LSEVYAMNTFDERLCTCRFVTLLDANGTSHWRENTSHHATLSVDNFRRSVDLILASNASINIYGFAGGTNFGLWNGATEDGGGDAAISSTNLVKQAVSRSKHRHHHRRKRFQHGDVGDAVNNQTIETPDRGDNSAG